MTLDPAKSQPANLAPVAVTAATPVQEKKTILQLTSEPDAGALRPESFSTNKELATLLMDEAEPPRTPSAWMMLDLVLALRQVAFLAWVI